MDVAPVTGPGTMSPVRAVAAGATLLLATLSGCGEGNGDGSSPGPAAGPAVDSARFGGSAVVAGREEISSMNALVSTGTAAAQIQRHVLFTTLVRYDSLLRPRPYLARSWEVADDSTEVVFHLREDVRWHDGEPTTAEDVAFTFRRAKDPQVPFANRSYFARWDSVEVLDPYTVRFHVRPTYALLLGWVNTPIMPEHVLGAVPDTALRTHPFGTRSPVGNGPFRFVEHRAGERWVFEANPEFPEDLGGRPYLDRLVYRVIPDPAARMAELRSGGVDFVPRISPSRVEEVRSSPDLQLASYPSSEYVFITWNQRRPLFREARVRKALTMAIDRPTLVKSVRRGYGRVADAPMGPWHWAFDSTWASLPHSPDSARVLLEAAGWRDRDGDGVRERNGRTFSFELITAGPSQRRDAALLVQSDLRDVGVEVSPGVLEFSSLISAVTGAEREYEAALLSWTRDLVVDDRDLWSCDRPDAPFAFAGYCSPGVEAVVDSLALARGRGERRRLLSRYREILVRDQPYTFLYHVTRLDAHRPALRGLAPDARGAWTSARRWWLAPDR